MSVFKQWPIYFVGRIAPAAISFFAIATYTRLLQPQSFGTYALLLSIALLVGTIFYSWLRVATLRMAGTPADADDEACYTATILAAFVVASIGVGLTVIATVRVLSPALPPPTAALAAAAAVASGWFELTVSLAQARLKLRLYGVLQGTRAVLTFGASLALIAAKLKVDGLLSGFVVGNAAATLIAAPLWLGAARGRLDGAIARRLFTFGWPSSAMAASGFSGTFQRVILDRFGGSAGVGIFSAASDFASQTVGLLMGTALIAGQPLAFRARDRGTHDELAAQMRNNVRLIFLVGLGATGGLMALAQPIANAFFGPAFRPNAAPVIMVSAAAVFVGGMRSSYFEQIFEIALDTRPIAILTACRVVVTVVLSAPLIIRFGGIGGAYAALAVESVMLAATAIWARRFIDLPLPYASLAKISTAAVVMVGVLRLIPSRDQLLGLACAVVAGAVAYGAVVALLHVSALRAYLTLSRNAEAAGRS